MVVLAVDQGREPVAGVALHPLPHVENRAAGRVDHDAADLAQRLEILDRDTECRQDHDIGRLHAGVIDHLLADLQNLDPHVPELPVHVRVVDDLACQ